MVMISRQQQQQGRHYHTHLLNSLMRIDPDKCGACAGHTNPNAQSREDERTIEAWLLSGMNGRLVRYSPFGPLFIEPSSSAGEWRITILGGKP